MKLIMMMIIFAFTVLLTTFTESSEIDKNSLLIENLSDENLAEHTSKIQKRTVLKHFGLKPRYNPIQISLNWLKSNQQRFVKNYNNRPNQATTNTRISGYFYQKNVIFYNGLNQNNPEITSSTTPKYIPTTEKVIENKSTMRIENTFSKPSIQQTTESLLTTSSTTEAAPPFRKQPTTTQKVSNTKTTQIYEITSSTTSKPQSEKPISVFTTTEPTVVMVTNNSNTKNTRGGFTSTSMPDNNQYSELIYDIDPRYRKK